MPTYEYRCKDCGDEIEVQQSFSDAALTECPACTGTLKKKFSSPGISFKGSGFYKTDSRGGGSSSTTATKDKDSGDKASTSATSGDSSSKSESATTSSSSTESAKPSTTAAAST